MTIDKHIYFTNEEYARIKDYSEKNKLSFSRAVCELSINALNGIDVLGRISKLDKSVESIIKKQHLMFLLEEQIYSDMNFVNLTIPKKSKSLNEFYKRIKDTNIND